MQFYWWCTNRKQHHSVFVQETRTNIFFSNGEITRGSNASCGRWLWVRCERRAWPTLLEKDEECQHYLSWVSVMMMVGTKSNQEHFLWLFSYHLFKIHGRNEQAASLDDVRGQYIVRPLGGMEQIPEHVIISIVAHIADGVDTRQALEWTFTAASRVAELEACTHKTWSQGVEHQLLSSCAQQFTVRGTNAFSLSDSVFWWKAVCNQIWP